MRTLGMPELLVIVGVAVLLFGGKKIPEVAKGLGQAIRNFQTALKEESAAAGGKGDLEKASFSE
jgi:sec-independent protein translocase protein TatA